MRNDEQFLADEIEGTYNSLADTAKGLYEAIGPSAVIEWGYSIGLKESRCDPCELVTPNIGCGKKEICAVCWSSKGE